MGAAQDIEGRLMAPRHLVIVGGGTAGWLAALMLADVARRKGWGTKITVIESSKIGTIGVGEGSTAVFRQMLKHLGLDEAEFLRDSGATIKYAIRHRDWRRVGHSYDGPIDDPSLLTPGLALDTYAIAAGRPVAEAHLFQHLLNANRAPVAIKDGRSIPAGPFHHAFHFDQARAGAWLRKNAKGIAVIDDQVKAVEKGERGITGLVLDSGARIEGDFFLDCTGFRALLMEGALHVGYDDWSHWLPCDSAIAVQTASVRPPIPYTRAIAHDAGWQWRIPLQHRTGNGRVYCSAFISDDEAAESLLAHLDAPALADPRPIRFTTGRRAEAWRGNVIAVGLASGFLEPLESTSIHLIQTAISRILKFLPGKVQTKAARNEYNRQFTFEMERIRDFIVLHYHVNQRPEPFWEAVRDMALPDTLSDRIELFRANGHIFRHGDELHPVFAGGAERALHLE